MREDPGACTKPSAGDCFVIPPITKQSPAEGLVQAKASGAKIACNTKLFCVVGS